MPCIEVVTELFHHRWNVPVLGSLHSGATRFVVLENRLGASRDALRASLTSLQSAGLVTPNPGYGHPLRPEYLLTAKGTEVAPACVRYSLLAERLGVVTVAFRKWTAPLLLALDEGHTRFNGLQLALESVSPRSLSQGLRAMLESDLVVRRVEDGFPPRPSYRLTRGGRGLASAIATIADRL
ncbi:MAG: winged helix-turn-helix transcriptional regulator [Acidimicrobiia bacterium]|nr:winged helix-turn-helix transcriptional regulator [Acidimicrobiia bacterium]MDH4306011.1 winged helix-turn-helix transcriptional regulator [Acidimicrobiia bacterium]MDH5295239.1 winged helix-turn-helix transcriptional regulator [Acidimicrobiia bacterium]